MVDLNIEISEFLNFYNYIKYKYKFKFNKWKIRI